MKVKCIPQDELYHHGIKGQKWGIRRYQNEDGTLTEAGRKRYNTTSDFNSATKVYDYKEKVQNSHNTASITSAMAGMSAYVAALPVLTLNPVAGVGVALAGTGAVAAAPVIAHIRNKKIADAERSLIGSQKDLYNIMNNTYKAMNDPDTSDSEALGLYSMHKKARDYSDKIETEGTDPRNFDAKIKYYDRDNYRHYYVDLNKKRKRGK